MATVARPVIPASRSAKLGVTSRPATILLKSLFRTLASLNDGQKARPPVVTHVPPAVVAPGPVQIAAGVHGTQPYADAVTQSINNLPPPTTMAEVEQRAASIANHYGLRPWQRDWVLAAVAATMQDTEGPGPDRRFAGGEIGGPQVPTRAA